MKLNLWHCEGFPFESRLCPAIGAARGDGFRSSKASMSHLVDGTRRPSLWRNSYESCTFLWAHRLPQNHDSLIEIKVARIPDCWRFSMSIPAEFYKPSTGGTRGGDCSFLTERKSPNLTSIRRRPRHRHNTSERLCRCDAECSRLCCCGSRCSTGPSKIDRSCLKDLWSRRRLSMLSCSEKLPRRDSWVRSKRYSPNKAVLDSWQAQLRPYLCPLPALDFHLHCRCHLLVDCKPAAEFQPSMGFEDSSELALDWRLKTSAIEVPYYAARADFAVPCEAMWSQLQSIERCVAW